MFLQATLDCPSFDDAEKLVEKYRDVDGIDYIELGAPMVSHYGVLGAHWLGERVDKNRIYVDTKMIDFPELELMPYIERGFTRFSAMAVMNDGAFRQLAKLREKHDLTIFVSLMGQPNVAQRAMELVELGFCDLIAHGAGISRQDAFANLHNILTQLKWLRGINIIAAGGLSNKNAPLIAGFPLSGVIVGRGLAASGDVASNVRVLRNQLEGNHVR